MCIHYPGNLHLNMSFIGIPSSSWCRAMKGVWPRHTVLANVDMYIIHSSSRSSPVHGVHYYRCPTCWSEFHECHLVPFIISIFLALSDGSYVVLNTHIVLDAHNVFLCSIFLDSRLLISKTLQKLQQWQSRNCQTFESLIKNRKPYEIVNRSWILTTFMLA